MEEWTNEEVKEVFDELAEEWLKHQRGELSKTAFNKLQTHCGWNYASGHSLLSSDMAARASLPQGVYYDWMHSLVSSGGVAQYSISQLLRAIRSLSEENEVGAGDATLALMDDMRNNMVWPKTSPKLRSLVLKERMPKKPQGNVRMFAAETLQIMVFLGLYCQMVLIPQGLLLPEVECFVLMGRILYLLRSGEAVLAKLDLLWQLILEHHDKFVHLWPGCAKIKLHLLLHIPGLINKFGVNLSCFAAERKHKSSKRIATFAFRTWCNTMLHRDLRAFLHRMAQPGAFQPYFMEGAAAIDWGSTFAAGGLASDLQELDAQEVCAALKTPVGTLWKKDLVAFSVELGFGVGFVNAFYKVRGGKIFASVSVLARVTETVYDLNADLSRLSLVQAQCLRGAFPYMPLDDNTIFLVASGDCFA